MQEYEQPTLKRVINSGEADARSVVAVAVVVVALYGAAATVGAVTLALYNSIGAWG